MGLIIGAVMRELSNPNFLNSLLWRFSCSARLFFESLDDGAGVKDGVVMAEADEVTGAS